LVKMIDWRQREEELSEAITQIGICLAQAIHEGDADAAQRMNFAAGKVYSRLLDDNKPLAADIVYRFGRALTDRSLFPRKTEPPAIVEAGADGEPYPGGEVS
jgi:hypothetical protein